MIQIRINTEITGPPILVTWRDWWPTRWNSYYGISFPSHPWHSPLTPSRFPPLVLPFPHIPQRFFSISIFYTLFHSPNSFFSHTAWLCVVLFIEEREETSPSLPADSFIYFNYLNWRLLLTIRRQYQSTLFRQLPTCYLCNKSRQYVIIICKGEVCLSVPRTLTFVWVRQKQFRRLRSAEGHYVIICWLVCARACVCVCVCVCVPC